MRTARQARGQPHVSFQQFTIQAVCALAMVCCSKCAFMSWPGLSTAVPQPHSALRMPQTCPGSHHRRQCCAAACAHSTITKGGNSLRDASALRVAMPAGRFKRVRDVKAHFFNFCTRTLGLGSCSTSWPPAKGGPLTPAAPPTAPCGPVPR